MFFLYDVNCRFVNLLFLILIYYFLITMQTYTRVLGIQRFLLFNVIYDATIIVTLELPGTDIIPFLETLSCT